SQNVETESLFVLSDSIINMTNQTCRSRLVVSLVVEDEVKPDQFLFDGLLSAMATTGIDA
ncbi:MAG: hypothetical protein AAGA73_12815, partial [Pseudomonadota bacterium]